MNSYLEFVFNVRGVERVFAQLANEVVESNQGFVVAGPICPRCGFWPGDPYRKGFLVAPCAKLVEKLGHVRLGNARKFQYGVGTAARAEDAQDAKHLQGHGQCGQPASGGMLSSSSVAHST